MNCNIDKSLHKHTVSSPEISVDMCSVNVPVDEVLLGAYKIYLSKINAGEHVHEIQKVVELSDLPGPMAGAPLNMLYSARELAISRAERYRYYLDKFYSIELPKMEWNTPHTETYLNLLTAAANAFAKVATNSEFTGNPINVIAVDAEKVEKAFKERNYENVLLENIREADFVFAINLAKTSRDTVSMKVLKGRSKSPIRGSLDDCDNVAISISKEYIKIERLK